ncbi:unnamed protein product [Adineta ricciae]|uniref:G-protein coupled receptors family 1 profile domain-containing protein n=1 Tax=Adineta ricciae TaxID=249248 RepID=A0A815KZS1_ADIRI|nr:unnamed protein product [Adineta ricciae]
MYNRRDKPSHNFTYNLSTLAFRNVHHIVRRQIPIARRRLDQQMTTMVLVRVIIYVCFLLPYVIYRIYAINVPVTQNDLLQYSIRQLIQTLFQSLSAVNFTISFYIFILVSPRYRRQIKFLLIRKYWRKCKAYCCGNRNQIGPMAIDPIDENIELE